MRNHAKIWAIALCALAAAACSDGGTQTSTVNGTVLTFLSLQAPAEVVGATVRVSGTNLSATTDQDGAFIIENVPNGENFFTVEAPGHWGTVDYWDVPTETNQGFVLLAATDADIQSVDAELDDRTISTDDGMVEIFFDPAVTGASGTIDPADHDPPFTLDAAGFLMVQDEVIAVEGVGDLFFTSVPAGGTITANVAGPSGTTCEVIESDTGTYPINAKSITFVYASCQ